MRPVSVSVPAKVNLQLSVGPERADGFHDLATVFHAVDLLDTVTAREASELRVTVEGEDAESVPADATNLVWRAAQAMADATGVDPAVHLHITKAIPVAGGMAGGSADAAAALLACDALWGTRVAPEELHYLAAELGSDVPFALMGGTAIGRGRGESLTPVLTRGTLHWAFAVFEGGLSTPVVYARCDDMRGPDVPSPQISDALLSALATGDAPAVGRALRNDLQPAAISLRPELADVLEVGEDYGALGQIVSGSGPTCAFLARDEDHALDIAVALTGTGLCRTVKRARGPVPGARVLR
jgi:4-diphosphocytidyl-2-C-methyl-D-erythritol kinase